MIRLKTVLRSGLRAGTSLAAAWGFSRLCSVGNTVRDTSAGGSYELLEAPFISIVILAGTLLMLFFESVLFASGDREEEERFFSGDEKLLTFKKQSRYLAKSGKFYTDTLFLIALHLIIPVSFAFRDAQILLGDAGVRNSFAVKLIILPALIAVTVPGYFSAFTRWIAARKKRVKEKKRWPLSIIIFQTAYCLSGLIVPAVTVAAVSVVRIVTAFWQIPALGLAAAAGVYLVRRLKEIIDRKRFLGELKAKETEGGFAIAGQKRLYGSVFFNRCGSLTVLKMGETLIVNLVFVPSKRAKLILDAGGELTLAGSLTLFGRPLLHRLSRIDYLSDPGARVCLLVTPKGRSIYFAKDGAINEEPPGSCLGKICVHDRGSLLAFLNNQG